MKEAHFLSEDPAYFDASFFNITRDIAATFTLDAIQKQLAYLVNSPEDNIDAAKSITGNGVDSIVSIELRT